MTFLTPIWLLVLVPVAVLVVSYLVIQRRRRRYAVRFASLPMLEKVVPKRPGWRRHVPAVLVLGALAFLGLAAARPELALRVPYERATVIVAIDTSPSMRATDVDPDRLDAAKEAAAQFVGDLPDTYNVGVVSFAASASVVIPATTEHDDVERAIDALDITSGGTAIGDAVETSVQQVLADAAADGSRSGDDSGSGSGSGGTGGDSADTPIPARLVLLSDGANTAGVSPEDAAQAARDADLPVSTIAYGTAEGSVDLGGRELQVPVDESTLRQLADDTGGQFYAATSTDQLNEVYSDIGSSIGWRTQQTEVTPFLAVAGLIALLGASVLSLRWFSRLI